MLWHHQLCLLLIIHLHLSHLHPLFHCLAVFSKFEAINAFSTSGVALLHLHTSALSQS